MTTESPAGAAREAAEGIERKISLHGNVRENHDLVARYWNVYLQSRGIMGKRRVEAVDVAMMMVLLKVARSVLGHVNPDDYVDVAGYGSIAGFLAAPEPFASDPEG